MSTKDWIETGKFVVPALIALVGGAIKLFSGGTRIQRQKQRLELITASLDLYKRVPDDEKLEQHLRELATQNLRRSTETIDPDSKVSREHSVGEYESRPRWTRWITTPRPHGVRGWIGAILFYTYGTMIPVYIVMGVINVSSHRSIAHPLVGISFDSALVFVDSTTHAVAADSTVSIEDMQQEEWEIYLAGVLGALLMAALGKWLANWAARRSRRQLRAA